MNSEELFRRLPDPEDPLIIKEISFDHQEKRVDIIKDFQSGTGFSHPICGLPPFYPGHGGANMEAPERIPAPNVCACTGTRAEMFMAFLDKSQ